MQFLGLTQRQSEIVRLVYSGESYSQVSKELELSEREVIKEEFIALSILSDRWQQKEADIKKQLKSLFLLALCLFLSYHNFAQNLAHYEDFDNGDFDRVTRTGRSGRNLFVDTSRASRGRRGGRKGGRRARDYDYDDEHDLFAMIEGDLPGGLKC